MRWTDVQEYGLRQIAEQCRGLHWIHDRTYKLVQKEYLCSAIALTTLIVATFVLTIIDDIKTNAAITIFRQITLFLQQGAVVYKIFVSDKGREITFEHLPYSKDYLNLSLTIENELRKPRAEREKATNFTKRIESEYRRLLNNNLQQHPKAIAEYKAANANTGISMPPSTGTFSPILINTTVEENEPVMPKSYALPEV